MAKEKEVCKWPACSCKATGQTCASKPAPKKKTLIARQSAKQKQKKLDTGLLVQNDAAFYLEVWQERPHICFACNKPITEHFSINLFHHVLPKKKSIHGYSDYSMYRHAKWNIVLLHWAEGCHGTADADNDPKVLEYKNKLIALHETGKLIKFSFNKQFIE